MRNFNQIQRRMFLNGLGPLMAVPWLESALPALGADGGTPALPRPMAYVFSPNGATLWGWKPSRTGTDFELPFILEPFLAAHRQDLRILSGLFASGTTADIAENRLRRERHRKSILDCVLDDARLL